MPPPRHKKKAKTAESMPTTSSSGRPTGSASSARTTKQDDVASTAGPSSKATTTTVTETSTSSASIAERQPTTDSGSKPAATQHDDANLPEPSSKTTAVPYENTKTKDKPTSWAVAMDDDDQNVLHEDDTETAPTNRSTTNASTVNDDGKSSDDEEEDDSAEMDDDDAFNDQQPSTHDDKHDDVTSSEDESETSPKRKIPSTSSALISTPVQHTTTATKDKIFYVYIAAKNSENNFANIFKSKQKAVMQFFKRHFVLNNIDEASIANIKIIGRTLRVDCTNCSAQNSLLDVNRIEFVDVNCTLPRSVTNMPGTELKAKHYRYVIHNIDCDYTEEEIQRHCKCEEVKLFNTNKRTRTVLLSFKDERTDNYVTIDYCRFKIFKYNPGPMRCYRCQVFGHTAANCRRDAPRCARCSQPHDTKDCTSASRLCVNCGLQHSSAWTGCAVYIEKRAAQTQPTPAAVDRPLTGVAAPTSSSSTTAAVRSLSSAPPPGAAWDPLRRTLPVPAWTLSRQAWKEQIDITEKALDSLNKKLNLIVDSLKKLTVDTVKKCMKEEIDIGMRSAVEQCKTDCVKITEGLEEKITDSIASSISNTIADNINDVIMPQLRQKILNQTEILTDYINARIKLIRGEQVDLDKYRAMMDK